MKILLYNAMTMGSGNNRLSSLHVGIGKVGQLKSQGEWEEEESVMCQHESSGKIENEGEMPPSTKKHFLKFFIASENKMF